MLKDKSLTVVQDCIWVTAPNNVTKTLKTILAKLQGSCVQMVESPSTSTICSGGKRGSLFCGKGT